MVVPAVRSCPPLLPLQHGVLRCSDGGASYRAECQVNCERGYRLEGDTRLTCQANSQWSGPQPRCVGKPPSPRHANLIYICTSGKNWVYGVTGFFSSFTKTFKLWYPLLVLRNMLTVSRHLANIHIQETWSQFPYSTFVLFEGIHSFFNLSRLYPKSSSVELNQIPLFVYSICMIFHDKCTLHSLRRTMDLSSRRRCSLTAFNCKLI